MPEAADKMSVLIEREQSALLVVDMQTRLLAAMPESEARSMLTHTDRLLRAADKLNVPVFVTEQYPKGLGVTDESIRTVMPEPVMRFEKTAFSACGGEGFKQALARSGRRQVIVVGQETHVCVLQTAFDLLRLGYRVFVVEDAVSSRSEMNKINALQRMRLAGIHSVCYESVLFEWLRDAAHADFKAISALVR